MATEISTLKVVVGTEDRQLATGLKKAESKIAAFSSRVGGLFKVGFGAGIGSTLTQLAGASIDKLRAAIIQQFKDTSRLSGTSKAIVDSATRAMVRFGQATFDAVQIFTVALSPAIERIFNGLTILLTKARPYIASFAKDIGRAFDVAVRYIQALASANPFLTLSSSGRGLDFVTRGVAAIFDVVKYIGVAMNEIAATIGSVGKILANVLYRSGNVTFQQGKKIFDIFDRMEQRASIIRDNLGRISGADIIRQSVESDATRTSEFVSTLRRKLAADLKRDADRAAALPFLKNLAVNQATGVAKTLNALIVDPAKKFGVQVFSGLVAGARFFNTAIAARLESINALESGLVGALEAGSMEAVQAEISLRDPLQDFKRRQEELLLQSNQKQESLLDTVAKGITSMAGALKVVGIGG